MSGENNKAIVEIRELLKVLVQEQKQLLESVSELKNEQKKIQEEIKISNFVLNNITLRNEIIN